MKRLHRHRAGNAFAAISDADYARLRTQPHASLFPTESRGHERTTDKLSPRHERARTSAPLDAQPLAQWALPARAGIDGGHARDRFWLRAGAVDPWHRPAGHAGRGGPRLARRRG